MIDLPEKTFGIFILENALKNGKKHNSFDSEQQYIDLLQKEIDTAEFMYISHGYDEKGERKEIAIRIIDKNRRERTFFCSDEKEKMQHGLLRCFSCLTNPISNHKDKILLKCKFKIYQDSKNHKGCDDAILLKNHLDTYFADKKSAREVSSAIILDSEDTQFLESNNDTNSIFTTSSQEIVATQNMQVVAQGQHTQSYSLTPISQGQNMLESALVTSNNNYKTFTQSSINILSCNEIIMLFESLFSHAKSYITIHCPWVYDFILRRYQPLIEKALKRGVRITIKIGMNKQEDSNQKALTEETQELLRILQDEYEEFRYLKRKNCDHSKVLLWDDDITEWILVGSFNFMSFYPQQSDNRQESAILTDSKRIIYRYKEFNG